MASRSLLKCCNKLFHHSTAFNITLRFCSTIAFDDKNEGARTIRSIFAETEKGTEELRNINISTKNDLKHNIYPSTIGNSNQLQNAWDQIKLSIETQFDYIQNKQSNMIPVIDMKRINKAKSINDITSSFIGDTIRKVGVFVITNVIDDNQIIEWKEELREYIAINRENGNTVHGFPVDNPQVYEIYWSKPQIKARQHPNMIKAIRFANNLWSFDSNSNSNKNYTTDTPIIYADRLRIREPQDESFSFLGPHLDCGGIERWQDYNYRMCYDDIFKLNWKQWNGYNANYRTHANMNLYNTENACTAFRSSQGWLSLSEQQTLRVSPLLTESVAYIMLRPFIELEDWNFCEIFGGYGLKLKEKYHQLLFDIMVSIPPVNPGDMVFWHCDTVHGVEEKNNSQTDSSVFYIPAAFDCDINSKFMKLQKETFLNGTSPPDFPQTNSELNWINRATVDDLDDLGKLAMHI